MGVLRSVSRFRWWALKGQSKMFMIAFGFCSSCMSLSPVCGREFGRLRCSKLETPAVRAFGPFSESYVPGLRLPRADFPFPIPHCHIPCFQKAGKCRLVMLLSMHTFNVGVEDTGFFRTTASRCHQRSWLGGVVLHGVSSTIWDGWRIVRSAFGKFYLFLLIYIYFFFSGWHNSAKD